MTRGRLPFDDAAAPESSPRVRQVFTVAQLTQQIRLQLESTYPMVWVEGEISNSRLWKTGHLYFTLKDGNAQIRGVMFRSALRYLRFKPEDGIHVVVRARVSVYEPKGEYQLVVEHLEPHGLGALQLAFDQLRQRLDDEGLFADDRKRVLPTLPRKVGIVTSLDGAALRDILTVLARRHPNAHVVISPTRVQGDGAAGEIIAALGRIQRVPDVEVVIVGRGGGSIEDLWAFNDERLARAIAAAPMPVVSAIGHETDYTISDFVADLRAPTPSAAAELVVAQQTELIGRIDRATAHLAAATRDQLQRRHAAVRAFRHRPCFGAWPARLASSGRQVDELTHRLTAGTRGATSRRRQHSQELRLRLESLDLGRQLTRIRMRLGAARDGARRGMHAISMSGRRRLETVAARLESLSPLGVLARGYAVCWNDDRTAIVRRASEVAVGDAVRVTLHDGELHCDVRKAE